ncbi:DUF4189 domain-containing protein [Nocardia sp. NPDC051030]|uniref:DUF4189 domain-containing protein n=1 Tax=Nocardia sp. NPDC051030 TaxID=3155162 RepID=UPI0034264F00
MQSPLRTITKVLVAPAAIATFGLGALIVPASAQASPTNWGAIAVSDDGDIGSSWNYNTKDEAKSAAMNSCHGPNCEVLVTFTVCGSVSHSRMGHEYNGRYGPSRGEAEDNARVHPDSVILKTVCND